MATLPGLVIKIGANTQDAIAGLNKVNRALGQSATSADRTAARWHALAPKIKMIGAAAAAAGAAIALKLGKDAVVAGAHLAESQSKVNVVFQDSADEINKWANTAAISMGMTEDAALSATGTFGNLFQAFGFGQDQAKQMSMSLVQMAADLSSFNDVSVDEAMTALRSGISGEMEPLKRLGISLTDVRLRQEALSQGIYSGVGVLNSAQKAQAAYNLIFKDGKLAIGDYKRTSSGAVNSAKTLGAALEDLQTSFGKGVIDSMAGLADQSGRAADQMVRAKAAAENLGNDVGNVGMGAVTAWDRISAFTEAVEAKRWDNIGEMLGAGITGDDAGFDKAINRLESIGKEFEYTQYAAYGVADATSSAADGISSMAAESEGATGALKKQKSAADKLKDSLDRLNGNDRSVIGNRLSIRRAIAEGPGKSGERKVKGADGKVKTKQFVTQDDKLAYALDLAGQFESLAMSMQADGATDAQLRKVFNRGGKVLDGVVGGKMSNRLLSTPAWLDRGNAGQRAGGQRYEQGSKVENNYYFGDLMVSDAADAAEQARRAARLKALGSGRQAEAARYSAQAGR